MKASRAGRIWAVIVAAAIALLPAVPALAEGTEENAPEDVILTAQEVELYINLDNNDDDPYVNDETCGFAFTSFSNYDSATWEVYAAKLDDSGEPVRLSDNLANSADYFQQGEEHADIALSKICDEFMSDVEKPQILICVELTANGEVIVRQERCFEIGRPHTEVNFAWADDVIKGMIGNGYAADLEFPIDIFNSENRCGEPYTGRITSVSSSDESVATACINQDEDTCEIELTGLGSATVTFTYECDEYPDQGGTFECTFEVVKQAYYANITSATGSRSVLRGSDVDFYTTIENNTWDENEGTTTVDTLQDGDSISYELDYAPEGTTFTIDPANDQHFTIHVPQKAAVGDDIVLKFTITGADGEVAYANTFNIACVSEYYYTPIKLVDATTGEELDNAITLKKGESITLAAKVYHVSAAGEEQATNLNWNVTECEEGINVEPTGYGTYKVSYAGEPTSSRFVLEYTLGDSESDEIYIDINPFQCERHQFEMSLEPSPTKDEPGWLSGHCTNCGETFEQKKVGLPDGGESYYATSEPSFLDLFTMLFHNNLGSIEEADPFAVIYFTRRYYNLFAEDYSYPYVCLSYTDLMDKVESLFAAPEIHQAVENYFEAGNYVFLDRKADQLVMANAGGMGDSSMTMLRRVESTSTGKIMHGVWGNLIGAEEPTEGTENVDYFAITFYDENGSPSKQYYQINERIRLALNAEGQVVAFEEEPQGDLSEVAYIAGADKICLYKEGGTPEIASMFRPQLTEENGGSFLEPGIDYELVESTYDPDTETASIAVKGIGAYTGTLTATMRTAPIKVTVADIPFDKAASPNTSDTVYETVSAKIDGEWVQLTRNTDYGVSFEGDLTIGADKPLLVWGLGNYSGFVVGSATYRIVGDITKATVKVGSLTYTGKNLSPKITVTLPGGINKYYFMDQTLKAGTDYTVRYKNAKGAYVTAVKNAGTYTAVITGKDCYTGTKNVRFTVAQKANPIKARGKTVKVKLAMLKKANQAIERKNAITVSSAQGKVTYAKKSGNAKITINKTTGKITVKKGLKKGTYKVQIKVTAAGNTNYKKIMKTVTVTIKVA